MRDYHDHETLERSRAGDRGENRRERPRSAFSEADERNVPYGRHDYDALGRHRRRYGERDPQFGTDAYREGLARDETSRLIASDKVEGTPIYDRNGRKLGSIYNLMLDKFGGEVVYAVVRNRSGFLGLDDRYFPLDWSDLTYDTRVEGYGVEFTEEDLERMLSRDEGRRERIAQRDSGFENYRPRFYW